MSNVIEEEVEMTETVEVEVKKKSGIRPVHKMKRQVKKVRPVHKVKKYSKKTGKVVVYTGAALSGATVGVFIGAIAGACLGLDVANQLFEKEEYEKTDDNKGVIPTVGMVRFGTDEV